MVWVGLLTTTKDSDIEEIEELISNEYHPFWKLFGEPLAQELPAHQSFDHQKWDKEAQ
jgi:hypothetical protein